MTALPRHAPAPKDDPAYRALKDAVIARTGHFYYVDKDDLLFERIEKRRRAVAAPTVAAYIERLSGPGGEAEWNALEAEITIGETFFFRFSDQFDALRRRILPEIIARNAETKRIRIWSAGCSTGAEAYSIAIVLRELLGDALQDWNVGVVGTDINDGFLAQARRGVYGRWALRTTGAADRDRWFTSPGPDGPWTLRPVYRGLAHFERHNLMSLLEGSSPLQFTGFDLILCRNVLIYFHTEAAERIVEALGRCLDPDGWLLLGHAETIPQFGRSLQRVDLPGVTAYRASAPAPAPVQPAPEPPPVFAPPAPPARPAREEPAARRPAAQPRPPAREPAPAPRAPAAPADALARLRAEADAGAFDKAADLARALAAALPSAPAPHYYEGLMARARDATGEAERSFRRAIYLDGGFAMAHYQLGLLLLGVGRAADARKALRNAARAAGAAAPDALLPEGDGLSAGALRALTRAALSSLEAR